MCAAVHKDQQTSMYWKWENFISEHKIKERELFFKGKKAIQETEK